MSWRLHAGHSDPPAWASVTLNVQVTIISVSLLGNDSFNVTLRVSVEYILGVSYLQETFSIQK
jgi:hypothetical protein